MKRASLIASVAAFACFASKSEAAPPIALQVPARPSASLRSVTETLSSPIGPVNSTTVPSECTNATAEAPICRGFNSLSGELEGTCITGKITQLPPDTTFATNTDYSFTRDTTSQEYRRETNLSISASMGSVSGSADVSANFYSSDKRSTYNDNVLIHVRMSGPSITINSEGITGSSNSANDFYTRCGTHYVKSVEYGAEFLAVATFSTNSIEERQKLQVKLDAVAAGYGDAHSSYSDDIATLVKNYHAQTLILRKGPSDNIPNNIDSIIQYANNFPTKLNSRTAYPISIQTASYRQLKPTLPSYSDQGILLDDFATRYGDLLAEIADLKAYANNRGSGSFYPPLSTDVIKVDSLALDQDALSAKLRWNHCVDKPNTDCKEASLRAPLTKIVVPGQAQTKFIDVKDATFQVIGAVGSGETKHLLIIGEFNRWDHGDDWSSPQGNTKYRLDAVGLPSSDFTYGGPVSVAGPAIVSAKVIDDIYSDNQSRGLQAILY